MRTSSLLFKARQPLDFRSAAFCGSFFPVFCSGRLPMAFFGRPPVLAGRSGLRFVSLSASFLAAFWPASGQFLCLDDLPDGIQESICLLRCVFWLKIIFLPEKWLRIEESFLKNHFPEIGSEACRLNSLCLFLPGSFADHLLDY